MNKAEFEYGYKFEDDEEETGADTVNINENSDNPCQSWQGGQKEYKKNV